jgi:hypothetical protein
MGSPKFPSTPVRTCPVPRPRWFRGATAARRTHCCLPAFRRCRLDHNDHRFRASIARPARSILPNSHPGLLRRTRDSLRPCQRALGRWDFLPQPGQGTHWAALASFKSYIAPIPSSRASLGGTAHFTRWLESQRLVVGLERSAAMLREARRLRTEGPLSRAAGVRLVGVVARSSVYPRRLCSLRTWIPLGDVLGVSARLR